MTAAHLAASDGLLPDDFDDWAMVDTKGNDYSVAHAAVLLYYHFPADWPYWGLTDKKGLSVAYLAHIRGTLPEDFNWDNMPALAVEVAGAGRPLPVGFNDWSAQDERGMTAAHWLAWHDLLPADFDQWELKGGSDITVAQAKKMGDESRAAKASNPS